MITPHSASPVKGEAPNANSPPLAGGARERFGDVAGHGYSPLPSREGQGEGEEMGQIRFSRVTTEITGPDPGR